MGPDKPVLHPVVPLGEMGNTLEIADVVLLTIDVIKRIASVDKTANGITVKLPLLQGCCYR